MIARIWRGWVRASQVQDYVDYVTRTGLAAYERTPGNLGAEIWARDVGDARYEVTTVSWWESLNDVRGFAGDDIDRAVFYAEDETYLIAKDDTVTHCEVTRVSRQPR
jgi:heme-degrading monooxygenase HmoA